MAKDLEKIRERFIEEIGLVAQDGGLPRIAGRLMGLMIFDGEARSFGDLARELRVSRGSISTNARMLEERGILRKIGVPGDRQDYYQLNENPYQHLLAAEAARARKAQSIIHAVAKELPDSEADIAGRVRAYENFYNVIAGKIEAALSLVSAQKGAGK